MARHNQREKWINVPYLKKFNEALLSAAPKYEGEIVYYYNTSISDRYMSYGEGTPAFYLFKLVPRDYLVRDFNHNNYWRRVDPDSTIIDYLLNKNLNKYKQSTIKLDFGFSYVLFVLQQIRISLPLINAVAAWAASTRNHVIFKAHPMETDIDLVPVNKYVQIVKDADTDYLVKNARAVWSRESGVGFYALLHNKPTSYFENTIDYNYGPIAHLSKTPEEAASNQHVPYNDIVRYFTWYYNKIAIDVTAPDFIDRLNNRLHKYFILKESNYELLTDY
jgi:hypothetical protein